MPRLLRCPPLLAVLLLLSGCDGQLISPSDPATGTAGALKSDFDSITVADSTILSFAYSSYLTPEGFYHEDLQGGSIYYENNLSIAPLERRSPPYYFLSTNDWQQALAWSESSAVNSSYYRDLVSQRETEKYFEFRRVYSKYPTDILLSRVHKLSYLDRSMYFYFTRSELIGRLIARPIDEAHVRELAEYLWFTESYNWYGQKVLAVATRSAADSVYCILYQLSMVVGDWGLSDQVSLHRTVVAVARSNGDIIRRDYPLRSVRGQYHRNPFAARKN